MRGIAAREESINQRERAGAWIWQTIQVPSECGHFAHTCLYLYLGIVSLQFPQKQRFHMEAMEASQRDGLWAVTVSEKQVGPLQPALASANLPEVQQEGSRVADGLSDPAAYQIFGKKQGHSSMALPLVPK